MRTTLKIAGAILSALITAISLALIAFDVSPGITWKLIAFISFIVFTVIVAWGWYSEAKHVEALESTRPSVTVRPLHTDDGWYWLEVRNHGHAGDFSASICIISDESGDKADSIYTTCWYRASSNQAHIMNNDFDRIVIAKRQDSTAPLMSSWLSLVHWNANTCERDEFNSPIWIPGHKDTVQARYLMEITIASEPALLHPFRATYLLDASQFIEHLSPSKPNPRRFLPTRVKAP